MTCHTQYHSLSPEHPPNFLVRVSGCNCPLCAPGFVSLYAIGLVLN